LKTQWPPVGGGSIPILITPIPYVNLSPQKLMCDANESWLSLKNRSNTPFKSNGFTSS